MLGLPSLVPAPRTVKARNPGVVALTNSRPASAGAAIRGYARSAPWERSKARKGRGGSWETTDLLWLQPGLVPEKKGLALPLLTQGSRRGWEAAGREPCL